MSLKCNVCTAYETISLHSAVFLRRRIVFCSTTNVIMKEKPIDIFAATNYGGINNFTETTVTQ